MENLRDLFKALLKILDMKCGEEDESETPDEVCRKVLINLGEEPLGNGDPSDLESFRKNITAFLQLMIRADALESAYEDAGSVDEALFNLLQHPDDLQ